MIRDYRYHSTHLARGRAIINSKATSDALGTGDNLSQTLTICVLGLGAQARNSQNLLVLLNTLLELAK